MLPTHVAFPRGFCGVNKVMFLQKVIWAVLIMMKMVGLGKDAANVGSAGNNLEGQNTFCSCLH